MSFRKLSKLLQPHPELLIKILVFITLGYFLTLYFFDQSTVQVVLENNKCHTFKVSSDVIEIRSLNKFERLINFNNDTNELRIDVPLRSKVFSLQPCPNSLTIVKEIRLINDNETRDILYTDSTIKNCIFCRSEWQEGNLQIYDVKENSKFEILGFNQVLPHQFRFTHLFLRYTPYLLTFGYLIIFYIVFSPVSTLVKRTFLITFLGFVGSLLYFEKIRNRLPNAYLSKDQVVGHSVYTGIPLLADYVYYILLLLVPYILFVLFKLINAKRK